MTTDPGNFNNFGFHQAVGEIGFKVEPGWRGFVLREQAEGALPNGTHIVKTNPEPDDANPEGTAGIVLGSLKVPEEVLNADDWPTEVTHFYCVEWETHPRLAVMVMCTKIAEEV